MERHSRERALLPRAEAIHRKERDLELPLVLHSETGKEFARE